MELISLILVGVTASLMVWIVILTIQEAFHRFEKKYSAAGQAHLEALYLTLTPRQLSVLSIASSALMSIISYAFIGIAGSIGGGLIGLFFPLLALSWLKKRRQQTFNAQLVSALGQMSSSLRAGFSLPQAIELIGQEMSDPLGLEFRIAHSEMRLGKSPVDSLKGIASRVQISDFNLVVNAIEMSDEVGGNLSHTFDNIVHTIRERFRVEGRIQSLSAMGRMQGLILIVMPLALLLFLTHFQEHFIYPLLNTTEGQVFCCLGALWLALGWISIQKIVNIDV